VVESYWDTGKPRHRLLAAPDIPEEKKAEGIYNTLNPVLLERRIEENLRALAKLPP